MAKEEILPVKYQNTYKVFDRYCVKTLLFQFSYCKDVFHTSGFKVPKFQKLLSSANKKLKLLDLITSLGGLFLALGWGLLIYKNTVAKF
jgi:hypothetical protein